MRRTPPLTPLDLHREWAEASLKALRALDLARSQTFLRFEAVLAAQERLGRWLPAGAAQRRAAVIWTVAWDIYLGYKTLQERARWWPGAVSPSDREAQHRRGADHLLNAARSLGGALIKAGQFASTRPDLLPLPYIERLSELQDRLPPQPWPVIGDAIENQLGRPLASVFAEIDPEPVSAASIAQVHRGRLKDGREVAVKVRHPGVAEIMHADLEALQFTFDAVAALEPSLRLRPITDYLRRTLPLELDLRREAQAMRKLREALAGRKDAVIPEPAEELVTGGLLVMEYVEGVKITDRRALQRAGIEPRAAAELLNDLYADQIFRRNVLHADPHPGNLYVQPGPQLVLLDHGLTVPLERGLAGELGAAVRALTAGDLGALSAALNRAGMPVDAEQTDLDTLLQLAGVLLGGEPDGAAADLSRFGRNLGASIGDIPPDLLLVGRAIGLLDGITRQLAPELDALEIAARYT